MLLVCLTLVAIDTAAEKIHCPLGYFGSCRDCGPDDADATDVRFVRSFVKGCI